MTIAKRSLVVRSLLWSVGATFALGMVAHAQLRVGAGKVDITPDAKNFPEPFASIHDRLFTRAILVENGNQSALLINLDTGKISKWLADETIDQIGAKYGIPRQNILIAAVHDHASVLNLGSVNDAAHPERQTREVAMRQLSPAMQAFINNAQEGMLRAVAEAEHALQPAEVGFGEGKLYLNANRDAIDPKTRLWAQEPELEYPSDKALAVMVFRAPHSGEPIAVFFNYAMHATSMFLREEISGDFPEAASQYIESAYGDKVVAEWTIGAAGDQNPLYLRAIDAIGKTRQDQEMDPVNPGEDPSAERFKAFVRLFNGPLHHPLQPMNPMLEKNSWQVVQAMGTIMAEEAMRVMGTIDMYSSDPTIEGLTATVACPRRGVPADSGKASQATTADGPPVVIHVGALRIGTIALAYNNSELYTKIGLEIKAASPLRDTVVMGLVNGAGEYVPSDDVYGHGTFQVKDNLLKPGCAEMGVVKTLSSLLYREMDQPAYK